MLRLLTHFLLCLSLSLCFGCSTKQKTEDISKNLSNKGLIVLSDTNPYLAGNIFLSNQAKESKELRGFLEHRGVPPAIEIDDSFLKNTQMFCYFPRSREHFRLEKGENGWSIFGPIRTPGTLIAKLLNATRDIRREPILLIFEDDEHSLQKSDATSPANTTPAKMHIPEDNTLAMMTLEEFRGSNLEDAEKNDHGDVIHKVTFQNETLRIIALWYTYDENNTERIAAINQISKTADLTVGDTIVIPAYLLKYDKEMPESLFK